MAALRYGTRPYRLIRISRQKKTGQQLKNSGAVVGMIIPLRAWIGKTLVELVVLTTSPFLLY
jgi:hypothetical protein